MASVSFVKKVNFISSLLSILHILSDQHACYRSIDALVVAVELTYKTQVEMKEKDHRIILAYVTRPQCTLLSSSFVCEVDTNNNDNNNNNNNNNNNDNNNNNNNNNNTENKQHFH